MVGLKSYDENRIKDAEIVQLIILYNLFSKKESKNIIFQGGTALRWFHGNERFSEDLDFVTTMDLKSLPGFLVSLKRGIEASIKAHFGPGALVLKETSTNRGGSYKVFVEFSPDSKRGKTVVKVEFEKLRTDLTPKTEHVILSSSPAVSYFIRTGNIVLPPGRVINIETIDEIFSDKVRALLERKYLKGRDMHDLWFMAHTLRIVPDVALVERKFEMYEYPFAPTRDPGYFVKLANNPGSKDAAEAIAVIARDLSRFIHADVMNVLCEEHFRRILATVSDVFGSLLENGLRP